MRPPLMVALLVSLMAALLVLGTGACADPAPTPDGLTATADTVDGVPRLLYAGDGAAALDWRADTVAVIGDAMGDDERYQFDGVPRDGLSAGRDGAIHLLDPSGSRVLVYGADGEFITSHGRRGSGPGELTAAFALAHRADTTWVMEMAARRLTGFPADAGEPRVVTLTGDVLPGPVLRVTADGILTQVVPMFRIGPGGGPEDDDERRFLLARFSPEGVLRDTVFSAPMPRSEVVTVGSAGRQAVMRRMPQFSPHLRWTTFADGAVALAHDDRYSIRIIEPDGTERLRVERRIEPRAVTEADQERVRERLRSQRVAVAGTDPGFQRELLRTQLETMTFAPTIPAIARLGVDARDRLWVARGETADGAPGDIDIFRRDGTLLGTVQGLLMPDAFLAGDRAAYLRRDPATDVQQVVIVRIREPVAA